MGRAYANRLLPCALLLLACSGPAAAAIDANSTGKLRNSLQALISPLPASWQEGTQPCNCTGATCTAVWEGILCGNSDTGITGLQLPGKGAHGQLPGEWATLLANITVLDLSNNNLTGTLPPDWSVLTATSALTLGGNRLGGSLPPQWQKLSNLQRLYLGPNMLTGTLPTNWSSLKQLSSLDLGDNHLQGGLPESWSGMTNLATLFLQQNHFSGSIPDSWSKMQVATLRLGGNRGLCGTLPAWMVPPPDGSAVDNFIVNITATSLTSPCWLSVLLGIRDLYWRGGVLSNEELLNCQTGLCEGEDGCTLGCDADNLLVTMNLENKDLPVLPAEFSSLTALQTLNFGVAENVTTLPPAWSALVNLKSIAAVSQTIKGTLPPEWSTLTALTFLDFEHNRLTGTIPAQYSTMPLSTFKLLDNNLIGQLPPTLSPMLEELSLSDNHLTGPLPDGWSTLTALTDLEIHINDLTGTLPASWSAMKSLSQAWIGNNQLSGTIPQAWSALPPLKPLRLLNNAALCGPLPSASPAWTIQSSSDSASLDNAPGTVLVMEGTALNSTCPAPPASKSGLSGGAIAGIVIAVLVAVALLAALTWFLVARRSGSGSGAKHRLPLSSMLSFGPAQRGGHGVTVVNTVQRPTFGAKPAPIGVGKRELEMELNSF